MDLRAFAETAPPFLLGGVPDDRQSALGSESASHVISREDNSGHVFPHTQAHAFPHTSTCTLPLPSRTHEVTPGATGQSQRHAVTPLCLRRGLRGHTATCQAHNNITSSHNSFMERSFVTLTPTVQMRTLGIKEGKLPARTP